MNKYSELSRNQMIEILNIIHPDTVWKFSQELDNNEKGTDTCIEFLGQDTSCAQFNIDQNEEDSFIFWYKMDDDFDTSEEEGKSILEKKEGDIDAFLNQLNGIKEENNSSEMKSELESPKRTNKIPLFN